MIDTPKLYSERKAVIDGQRSILDKAEAESRDLSAEEKAEYELRETSYADLTARITRAESANARDKAEAEANRIAPLVSAPEVKSEKGNAEKRVAAFLSYMRTGNPAELRATTDPQNITTDADGGYTVPDEWFNTLQLAREEANVMRGLATVIRTSSGTLNIPSATHGVAAWVSENSAIAVAKETFASKTLSAFKAARIITITAELLNDSMFDLSGYIMGELGRSIGVLEETGFIVGDNSGQPNGIVTAATTGVTAASGTAVTADELIELFHSVGAPYRNASTAAWLMADATALLIRKLKDGNGVYMWQPGLQGGQPDRLLARPVHTSENVPAATTGLDSILFGDIKGYWIADRVGLTLQRLVELYAVNDLVGFKGTLRTDGELIDAAAVRVMTMG